MIKKKQKKNSKLRCYKNKKTLVFMNLIILLFPATSSSSNSSLHVLSNLHKEKLSDYGYTREEEEEEEEPEYAVVQKRRDNPNYRSQTDVESVLGARASHASSDDYSSTGAMPPEPPRLYNAYEDEDDDVSYSVTSPGDEKTGW